MAKWVKDESSFKPDIFQKLNDDYWAYRKNIEKVGNMYHSDMRIVTTLEKNTIESVIDGARVPIEDVGKLLDNNDTTLMGAIADTYEESSQNSVIMEALADIYEAIISKE